ncbi:hypothetical protein Agub_g13769 [Astrephomene gubernaculifera]|uniref:gamma-glutamylcyclotransferase n=1 Tax=Astrephomene gubernaculifera TaxID=47775 RepID=A0AAD3E4K2_9CHLO|nr:hypothetical protein Agub_g13769 [Astrephomene gubernaculifera]
MYQLLNNTGLSWLHCNRLPPRLCPHIPSRQRHVAARPIRRGGRVPLALAWLGPLSWEKDGLKQEQKPAAASKSDSHPTTSAGYQQAASSWSSKSRCTPIDSYSPEAELKAGKAAGGAGIVLPDDPVHGKPAAEHQALGPQILARPPPRRPQRSEAEKGTVLTFAYGANMNFLTLARRGVRVLSRDPAFISDSAVRLVFKHRGGHATLERAEAGEGGSAGGKDEEPRFRPYDGRVHGVLYRMSQQEFEKLSKSERGYVLQELEVQTYDGARHVASVFVSNPLFRLGSEVLPPEQYLAGVREGARDNYLEPGYQAFLSGISTVPGAGLGSEYYSTPSKYMAYSFLLVVGLIALAYLCQQP